MIFEEHYDRPFSCIVVTFDQLKRINNSRTLDLPLAVFCQHNIQFTLAHKGFGKE